jgi:hypothetical protein
VLLYSINYIAVRVIAVVIDDPFSSAVGAALVPGI